MLDGIDTDVGEPTQVILYNDDVHSFQYVIVCLVRTFGHSAALAEKIAVEADARGRAIAEVEPREEAERHARLLRACGLRADTEEI